MPKLAQDYASSDDEDISGIAADTFGLSSLPPAKKVRVETPPPSSSVVVPSAAPDVLSEVSSCAHLPCSFICFGSPLRYSGSAQTDLFGHTSNGHQDECEHPLC